MNGRNGWAAASVLLLVFCSSWARVKKARSYKKLNIILSKSPFSAVMLYPETKELRRDKSWRSQLRDTQIMFRSVSDDDFYKAADLNFIQAKANKGFAEAPRKYNVQDVPKFLLFQGREPMYGTLAGFIYRDQLENFINRNLKTELDQRLKEKQKAQKRKLEQAKIDAYNRAYQWGAWGPYWAYGYWPYWQGPYFNYGWYW